MSKYTTQLRWICEQLGSGLDVPEGQEYADAVYKYIGLDKYPIYDEEYRTKLNDKIIDHYWFREIGFETAAQFAWYLRRTMNEIMPKYNRLYESLLTDLNHPLSDWTRHRTVDSDTHSTGVETLAETNSSSGTSQNATTTANANTNIFSDTPMSMLNNAGEPQVSNMDYATNVTYDNDSGTTNSSGNTSQQWNKNDTTQNVGDISLDRTEDEYGRSKSLALLIKEYSENFTDIDLMVIDDLEDLFMGLW